MVAFFVRRLVGGIATLLLSTFVLHSLLVYIPGGIRDMYIETLPFLSHERSVNTDRLSMSIYGDRHRMGNYFEVGKPWPHSYLAWLFDPNDTDGEHATGSGLLTGDFGESVGVALGHSTIELIGSSFWLYDLIILSLTLLGMVLVVFKRIGHAPRFAPPQFPFTPHDRVSLTFRYTQHS